MNQPVLYQGRCCIKINYFNQPERRHMCLYYCVPSAALALEDDFFS